jgi:hypothetical protein
MTAEQHTKETLVRRTHMCINVRGAVRNFRPHEWRDCVTTDDGRVMTPSEVLEYFIDEIAKGRRVIPLGEPCEGFSYETGCPGHDEVRS